MNDIDILNQICPNIQFDLSKHYEMDEPEEVEFVEALQKAMPIPASWERIVNPMKLTGIRIEAPRSERP